MPTYALLLAYDGTGFAGWWRQSDRRTVAGELDAAFARLGEAGAAAVGASRTDAGVHARGQVAHVALTRAWAPADLVRALDQHLPDDCRCLAAAAVDDAWHACHGAVAKTYSYRIDNGAAGDPFAARTAWRPPFRLDPARLAAAAALIPGRRDWRGFARRGEYRADLERTLATVAWRVQGDLLVCTLGGDGFIYHLARSLVGAMVAVAHGGCRLEHLEQSLAGADTPAGHQQAPARGLCLEAVDYAPPPAWARPA